MVLAARGAAALGLAPAGDGLRLTALLSRFGLPTTIPPGLNAEHLLARMRLDKKAVSGGIRLVLWRGIGQAFIATDVPEDSMQIGRAHVRTPVTNAHHVCRLLLAKKNHNNSNKVILDIITKSYKRS